MFVVEGAMRIKKNTYFILRSALLLLLAQLVIACAGVNPMSPGAWVEEKDRVPVLQDGRQQGSWKTPDLSIEYELKKEANRLQISGVVDFGAYITKGFSTLEYLYIYIHTLKENGIVVKTIPIKTFGYRRHFDLLGKMSFKGDLDISGDVDIVAVAFSYSGTVMEGGGRTTWDFWKVPHRKPPA